MKNLTKSWWGASAAVACVIGFGVITAFPYLSGAARTISKGETLSLTSVINETKRKEHEEKKNHPDKLLDFKSAARLENGTLYLGSKGGLLVREGENWHVVKNAPADDVKNLTAVGNTLWIAGKNGLYEMTGDSCNPVKSGDFHSVNASPDGSLYAVSKSGVFSRDPSGKWHEITIELADISSPAKP